MPLFKVDELIKFIIIIIECEPNSKRKIKTVLLCIYHLILGHYFLNTCRIGTVQRTLPVWWKRCKSKKYIYCDMLLQREI